MILHGEAETLELGKEIGRMLRSGDKISLAGDLGVGKTSLARGILQGAGFAGEVPSPTFAIMQHYEPPETRLPVAHVDLYRIENPAEIRELGLDEILFDGALIAEWPDRMDEEFWHDALKLRLEAPDANSRRLTWQIGTAWKDRWPVT